MIRDEVPLGNIKNRPFAGVALLASERIEKAGGLVALGMNPDGAVYLDTPEGVVEEDAVGYYRGEAGDIEPIIYRDLKHEAKARGLRP